MWKTIDQLLKAKLGSSVGSLDLIAEAVNRKGTEMTQKDTGGPAFPVFDASRNLAVFGGMSLRDYYMAHAPIDYGLAVAMAPLDEGANTSHPDNRAIIFATMAKLRTEYADAMLAERSK